MKGLEISILNFSDVSNHTISNRFDSEFFQKKYLVQDKAIMKNGFNKLKDVVNKIDVGFVGSMVQNYRDKGISLLQTKNIDSFFVVEDETVKITESFHNELKKSQINKENILIARSGSFGKAAIYLRDEIVNSSDIIIVDANKDKINPYFLTTFLNSKYGANQMIRFSSGGIQGHVNLTILEELEIPVLLDSFQKCIGSIIQESYELRTLSNTQYHKAENLLLKNLGLQNFQPFTKAVNIKSFRESFDRTGRLDAEYYQVKYEQLILKLKSLNNKSLKQLVDIKKSIEPGSEAYKEDGIPFIRISNITKFGISDTNIFLDVNMFGKTIKPKKDTILLTKDGTVGIAYKVEQDANFITSGALLHLTINSNEILPDYLTLVLNSIVVKLQAERDSGGSIIKHWKPSEIEQVIIPILNINMQKQISDLIHESFELKIKSKHLLQLAKHCVELAIDESEKVALEFLNKNK